MSHQSVLLHEIIGSLRPKAGDTIVDATFGGGGVSIEIAKATGAAGRVIAFDADASVFERPALREVKRYTQVTPVVANFREIAAELECLSIEKIDGIVFDLGLSSLQLEESGRGFTFQKDEPLMMTFNASPEKGDVTAEIIVNRWKEENIAAILKGFGEERYAKRIASAIQKARERGPLRRTGELLEVIQNAIPARYRRGRTHFATRTFQALRMATNDELSAIETAVTTIVPFLRPGARMAVVTFHSVEDRTVKHLLRSLERTDHLVKTINKKPITPGESELAANPRSRSAKLRVVEKI